MSWVLRLSIALLTGIIILILMFVGGCFAFGPISHARVADELARYVTPHEARRIVERDCTIPGSLLEELSGKWLLDDDAITLLLLHPNFPQTRRSAMIRTGKSAYYLENASHCLYPSITDEDVKAMLTRGKYKHCILRQTLECRGLSNESYRAVYVAWLDSLERNELEDSRFLVVSANLPQDVRDDLRTRLSHVGLPQSFGSPTPGRIGYIHVRDDWKDSCEFYILCDDFLGTGSLFEFIRKARHYNTLDELKAAAKGRTLYKDSNFGVCGMEYSVL